ncbi:hypothetical protein BDV25DRAFT_171316 [Aspergillus avenaceus]|uniref:Short-chain dehydrogenase n=1 Tax=Aspergillus avenaceus TaxID=36643 RepID=A0A5N6U081_ASPAV|nr:hypothetical protein BDV25DRAFT_171316 [Aspergillus avenaceus]
MPPLPTFIYNQLFHHPQKPTQPLTHKTIIITGANSGLGLEAARHIVSLGARAILGVRDMASGHAAKASIEDSTSRPDACEVWEVDLASYASVLGFAERVNALPRVDGVICNAAIATREFRVVEGHESSVTVNVVSSLLLGVLVLPKLRGCEGVLSFVVSEVHAWTGFVEGRDPRGVFVALDDADSVDMYERYPTSKLLLVLAVREMVTRLRDGGKVVVNMVNPGFCHSRLARDAGWGFWVMKLLLARSTEEGSRTLVAALSAGGSSHGKYMDCGKVDEGALSDFVRSADGLDAQRRVWGELEDILEGIKPGVLGNL